MYVAHLYFAMYVAHVYFAPQDFLANNAYASPGCYIDNPDLLKEFEEECTSSKISLQSVHDCLTAKLDPGVAFKKFHGNRPMHYAARHGDVMMARMLIRAGGKVQVRTRGATSKRGV